MQLPLGIDFRFPEVNEPSAVLGCEADVCAREIETLGVIPIICPHWKDGLGRSLADGITALEKRVPNVSGALIMLADPPTVTSDLLEKLLATWLRQDHAIATTKYQDGNGVPAIFHRDFFPKLRALQGDRGARLVIAQEAEHFVLIEPDCDLLGIDTPEIYDQHHPRAASNENPGSASSTAPVKSA